MKARLEQVAHTRSGDKGNTSNIAVFAYEPALYPLLKEQLTAERFKAFHREAITGEVLRYEAENLHALNFVAHGAWTTTARRCRRPSWASSSTCPRN